MWNFILGVLVGDVAAWLALALWAEVKDSRVRRRQMIFDRLRKEGLI